MIPAPLDLTGCAAEPIRVPGSIQTHGWLIAIDAHTAQVAVYSDNCEQLTGLASGAAQTAALQPLVDTLRPRLAQAPAADAPASIGSIEVAGRRLDATCHRIGSLVLIELEPASPQRGLQAAIYALARRFVPRLEAAGSITELVALAAEEMKQLTGFGRCVVYSFDVEGHGAVLAERADPGYLSYIGHSFPATDIPAQARDLYLRNHIRLIPDANYVLSGLYFATPASEPRVLDLSFAQLRSISPVHLEYMRNMGTLASMSVSIVVRGRLWGLISCHNHEPQTLDVQTRFACEHLGRLLSLQIAAKEDNAQSEMRNALRNVTMAIVSRLGESSSTLQNLVDEPALLLRLGAATGAAVVFDDACWTTGITPPRDQLMALAAWVLDRGAEVFETDDLGASGAPAAQDPVTAAGLLAISLSQVHRHLVIWFRPERVRSVRWAGDGSKTIDSQGRLHPRRSFESWEQTVRGRCDPWAAVEVAAAAELRQSLIGIVLHRAQERAEAASQLGRVTLAKDLAERADSAKTHFLAMLSHELRTPLASISNAAELLGRHASVPEKFASLVPMIKRNVGIEARLIDDILDVSAVSAGKLKLSTSLVDMNTLIGQVVETLNQDIVAKDLRLTAELSPEPAWVMADSVRMQQVLWNILRNAVKFTPRGGLLEIDIQHKGQDVVVTCRDSGIGSDANSLSRIFVAFEQADLDTYQSFGGLGLGLAIAMGIVTSHGGELEAASDGLDCGATFTLRLPAVLGPHARA